VRATLRRRVADGCDAANLQRRSPRG
jgi:hypothetical protein